MTDANITYKLQSIHTAIKESNIRPAQQFIDLYKMILKKVKTKLSLEYSFFAKSDLFNLYIHHLFLKFGSKELTIIHIDELFSYINRYRPNVAFITNQHFEIIITNLIGHLKDLKNTLYNIMVLKTAIHLFNYFLKNSDELILPFYIVKASKTFSIPGLSTAQMNVKTRLQNYSAKESSILRLNTKNSHIETVIKENKLIMIEKGSNGNNELIYEDIICELYVSNVYDIEIIQKALSIFITVTSDQGVVGTYQRVLFKNDISKKDFILFDNFNYELLDLIVKIQENIVFSLTKDYYAETDLDGCFEVVDRLPVINKTAILRDLQVLYYFYSATLDHTKSIIPQTKHSFFSVVLDLLPSLLTHDYLIIKQIINFIDYLIVCDEEKSMYNAYFKYNEVIIIDRLITSIKERMSSYAQEEIQNKIEKFAYRLYKSVLSRIYLFIIKPTEYPELAIIAKKAFSYLLKGDETALLSVIHNFVVKIHFYSFYHQKHSDLIRNILFALEVDAISTFFIYNLLKTIAKINCVECSSVILEFILLMLNKEKEQIGNGLVQKLVELVNFIFATNLEPTSELLLTIITGFKALLPNEIMVWVIYKIEEYNIRVIKDLTESGNKRQSTMKEVQLVEGNKLNLQSKRLGINPDKINMMFDFGGEQGTHKDAKVKLNQEIIDLVSEIVEDMEISQGFQKARARVQSTKNESTKVIAEDKKGKVFKNLLIDSERSDEELVDKDINQDNTNFDPVLLYLVRDKCKDIDVKVINLTLDLTIEYIDKFDKDLASDILIINYVENCDTDNIVEYLTQLNASCLDNLSNVEWCKLLYMNYRLLEDRNFDEGYFYLVNGILNSGKPEILIDVAYKATTLVRRYQSDSLKAFISDLFDRYLERINYNFGAKFSTITVTLFYLILSNVLTDSQLAAIFLPKAVTEIIKQFTKLGNEAFNDKDSSLLFFAVIYIVIKFSSVDNQNIPNLTTIIKLVLFKHDQKFIDKNWHIIMMILYLACQKPNIAEPYFEHLKSYCNSDKTIALLVAKYNLKPNMGKTFLILKSAFASFTTETFDNLATIYETQLQLLNLKQRKDMIKKFEVGGFVDMIYTAEKSYNKFIEYKPYISVS